MFHVLASLYASRDYYANYVVLFLRLRQTGKSECEMALLIAADA